ncbi:hypothetical protein Nwi_2427 [Nitrobacter winogradskyi Nb-255]|uniref:Uncharacterized protein n=1 Tax=Nitrobacter winogradskyi (strain ATCC 25391 / DSM 10237 / CIP 104748 / NCIMB 11846 / Nb-255) TaxID=323098 RepID=Q3SPW0_NITWN|nr:hypothetical protein Nwi_2427 [Nitrobacter winogradskyi Nb-255]
MIFSEDRFPRFGIMLELRTLTSVDDKAASASRRPFNETGQVAGDATSRSRPVLVRRRPLPERVGCFIVPVATAQEHQKHQSASDDERKERAEPKRDPAVFSYLDTGRLIQDRDHPHAGGYQYARQRNQNDNSAFAHVFHRDAFPWLSLAA